MESTSYTSRIVVCISCARMTMISDPSSTKNTSGFWSKSTFHLTVCSMCESIGSSRITTTITVYTDDKIERSTYLSTSIIKGWPNYTRACDMCRTTLNMGDVKGRVPVVNRNDLIRSFPDRTQINYISVSDRKSTTMGMRPYMVTNFF